MNCVFWVLVCFDYRKGGEKNWELCTEVSQGVLLERGGKKEVMAEGEVEEIVLWGHIGEYRTCLHIDVFDPVETDNHDAGKNGDSFSREVIEQARGRGLMPLGAEAVHLLEHVVEGLRHVDE